MPILHEAFFATNHEISLVQHSYIGTKIKLDPASELGTFDLGSGKMLVHPGIKVFKTRGNPHAATVTPVSTRKWRSTRQSLQTSKLTEQSGTTLLKFYFQDIPPLRANKAKQVQKFTPKGQRTIFVRTRYNNILHKNYFLLSVANTRDIVVNWDMMVKAASTLGRLVLRHCRTTKSSDRLRMTCHLSTQRRRDHVTMSRDRIKALCRRKSYDSGGRTRSDMSHPTSDRGAYAEGSSVVAVSWDRRKYDKVLIELYRSYEVLWYPKNINYKVKIAKYDALAAISTALDIPKHVVERSGADPEAMSTWTHFRELLFLKDRNTQHASRSTLQEPCEEVEMTFGPLYCFSKSQGLLTCVIALYFQVVCKSLTQYCFVVRSYVNFLLRAQATRRYWVPKAKDSSGNTPNGQDETMVEERGEPGPSLTLRYTSTGCGCAGYGLPGTSGNATSLQDTNSQCSVTSRQTPKFQKKRKMTNPRAEEAFQIMKALWGGRKEKKGTICMWNKSVTSYVNLPTVLQCFYKSFPHLSSGMYFEIVEQDILNVISNDLYESPLAINLNVTPKRSFIDIACTCLYERSRYVVVWQCHVTSRHGVAAAHAMWPRDSVACPSRSSVTATSVAVFEDLYSVNHYPDRRALSLTALPRFRLPIASWWGQPIFPCYHLISMALVGYSWPTFSPEWSGKRKSLPQNVVEKTSPGIPLHQMMGRSHSTPWEPHPRRREITMTQSGHYLGGRAQEGSLDSSLVSRLTGDSSPCSKIGDFIPYIIISSPWFHHYNQAIAPSTTEVLRDLFPVREGCRPWAPTASVLSGPTPRQVVEPRYHLSVQPSRQMPLACAASEIVLPRIHCTLDAGEGIFRSIRNGVGGATWRYPARTGFGTRSGAFTKTHSKRTQEGRQQFPGSEIPDVPQVYIRTQNRRVIRPELSVKKVACASYIESPVTKRNCQGAATLPVHSGYAPDPKNENTPPVVLRTSWTPFRARFKTTPRNTTQPFGANDHDILRKCHDRNFGLELVNL
ncbi:hypothetical protein PR048_006497 [Dryococelus australis]|uniref:Uncharacterized protein n=1 Tax=Dryococelus australis TaxID=614101 RepID=A0ABQ9IB82_9NEOP|nr:hypothetical protein PR048_006497 [Dryococelus australis]